VRGGAARKAAELTSLANSPRRRNPVAPGPRPLRTPHPPNPPPPPPGLGNPLGAQPADQGGLGALAALAERLIAGAPPASQQPQRHLLDPCGDDQLGVHPRQDPGRDCLIEDQLAVAGQPRRCLQLQPDADLPLPHRGLAAQQPMRGPRGRPHQPGRDPVLPTPPCPNGLEQPGQGLGLQVLGQPRERAAQRVDPPTDPWQQHPGQPDQPRPTLGLGAANQPRQGSIAGVEPDRGVQQQAAQLIQRDRPVGQPIDRNPVQC
jgi:hypothetical protein